MAGGVYKYTLGRNDLKVQHMGPRSALAWASNTWAAFYGSPKDA